MSDQQHLRRTSCGWRWVTADGRITMHVGEGFIHAGENQPSKYPEPAPSDWLGVSWGEDDPLTWDAYEHGEQPPGHVLRATLPSTPEQPTEDPAPPEGCTCWSCAGGLGEHDFSTPEQPLGASDDE